MGIEQIYSEILKEHANSMHNKHHLTHATQTHKGINPSCGDEIELEVFVEDCIVKDASFTGSGCAISQASASMMIDLIKGKTVEEAKLLTRTFTGMIKNEIRDEEELEILEDAVALKDISHMPARVKCAVLGWHTLEDTI
ncbi:MAG TPA: SUF system NifU family Fe-S cluster assembly protein [Mobilitalea sp.]|nr:SUF system NifU family Fe-S cluster assembly protein [Mobilitalea sp.]